MNQKPNNASNSIFSACLQGKSSIFTGFQVNKSASDKSTKQSEKNPKQLLSDLENDSTTLKKLRTDDKQSEQVTQIPKNTAEVVDHTKPRRFTSIKAHQQILQFLFTKQGINPLWIVLEDKHLLQNYVMITVEVPNSFESSYLNDKYMPFLSQYYIKSNIAVFKERLVQNEDNYWHQLFQNKQTDEVSLPLFNKNTNTFKPLTDSSTMSYEQKLLHKFESFCLSAQTLKDNLYPLPSEDFSDFRSTAEQSTKKPKKIENLILGLDCEMVTTEFGQELARLSLVNFEGEILIDELVKTPNRVINYNTQYSGITLDMLKDVKTDLAKAQELLFEHVDENTILIGHSLENDLLALKVIHQKVIDTSLLYMTKTERKLKLRDLAQKFLNCKIQQGSHSPSEDSLTAMSLAKLRIEILDKFDNSKISDGTSSVTLDLLDVILKSNNTVLVLEETDKLMRLLQYGVHYDELKQNTTEEKLEKILKWVSKKKRENCFLPRAILSKIQADKEHNYKELDSKLKEIFNNSPSHSLFVINFEPKEPKNQEESKGIVLSNPFSIFIGTR